MTTPSAPPPAPAPSVAIYTVDQMNQILQGYYTKDDVDAYNALQDARIAALTNPQPPVVVPPTPQVPQGIAIGASNLGQLAGTKIGAQRIYNGFGAQRQQNPTLTLANVTRCQQKNWRPALSLGAANNKAHPGGPQNWPQTYADFMALPLDSFTPALKIVAALKGLACWHHEPEDDPGDAKSFKQFFGWMSDYYRKQIPGLRIAVCLMSWTGSPANPHAPGYDYWCPDPSKFDVFAIDGYAHGAGDTAQGLFGGAVAYARKIKKRFAIFETGTDAQNQVPFIQSIDPFIQANKDITEMVTYWPSGNGVPPNGHNYHFSDAGLAAFQAACGNGHWYTGSAV